MKFSIIIPVYNRAGYIKTTLTSVLKQAFKNFEVLCVDDGSTDNSAALLQEYAEKDSRIKILTHAENKGPHAARKTGVVQASGDYILFLDCDDSFTEHALTTLSTVLENKQLDVLEFAHRSLFLSEIIEPNDAITAEKLFPLLVYPPSPSMTRKGTVWNKVYRTEFLKLAFSKMPNLYAVMGEDFYESVIIAYYAKRYTCIHDIIILYNDKDGVSNARTSIQTAQGMLQSYAAILNGFTIFFTEHAPEHIKALPYIERYFIFTMYYTHILGKIALRDKRTVLNMLPHYFTKEVAAPYVKKSVLTVFCGSVLYCLWDFSKKIFSRKVRNKIKRFFFS